MKGGLVATPGAWDAATNGYGDGYIKQLYDTLFSSVATKLARPPLYRLASRPSAGKG